MTADGPAPTTVLDRLIAAGLSESRIEQHMTAERVRVDGELVTDVTQTIMPTSPKRPVAPRTRPYPRRGSQRCLLLVDAPP
jgi:hypothetical protein